MEETTNTPNASSGKNWKVIVGIIVLVLVVGVVVFGMGGGSENENGTGDETANKGSLRSLLAMTGSQKCTVSSKTDAAESTGEVYISNGMMRGNFTAVANGQTMASHMIVKNDTSYVWTDGMTQGFMMTFGDVPTSNEGAPEQAVDVNQEYSYDCDDWSEDAGVFEAPSDVTFTDVKAMMGGQIPEGMMPTGN